MTALRPEAMTLGDMLALARMQSAEFARWLQVGQPNLAQQLREGLATGASLLGEVRAAIAHFAAEASESDWATPISAARDADDPGRAALGVMLHRWLRDRRAR